MVACSTCGAEAAAEALQVDDPNDKGKLKWSYRICDVSALNLLTYYVK